MKLRDFRYLTFGKGSRWKRTDPAALEDFAAVMRDLLKMMPFKVSARGWGYQMETMSVEGKTLVTKDQFDKVETSINDCRAIGLLPYDFVADEVARSFENSDEPDGDPVEFVRRWRDAFMHCENRYIPDYWEGEEYYLQMVVEKVDLVSLFRPLCKKYHIPLANTKGWSSILQRAEFARRFAEHEDEGQKCVLLDFGDHDPPGLCISDSLRSNLADIKDGVWEDGFEGYDPCDLIVDRFGLSWDFVEKHHLSVSDNLISGGGKDLADPGHRFYGTYHIADYIKKFGKRKCEANAVIPLTIQPHALKLCEDTILKYLGAGAAERFKEKQRRMHGGIRAARDELIRRP